ncbi:MAG: NosD domain-containing protein [Phycisphaerae bacterium]|jgi:parallel beta-helix repeat protein
MRSSLFAFVCVIALIMATASQATPGGDDYADDGGQLRQGRTDCNSNGIDDEIEMSPLGGNVLLFDGENDYVVPGESWALDGLGQEDFTVEAWIWTADTGHSILVGNAGSEPQLWNFVIRGEAQGGVVRIRFESGDVEALCDGVTTVTDSAWHHVAAVRRVGANGSLSVYVDGILDATIEVNSPPFVAYNQTYIGREAYDSYKRWFNGAMDEVRIWSVARSGAEIAGNMYQTLNGTEPGLVGYWRFDESEGTTAADSTGGPDADLIGPPVWVLQANDCNGNGVPDECETIVNGVIYVDDDATGGLNDGLSWTNAFEDLQDALAFAECDSRITEIRVAGGTYKPGTNRGDSFHLLNGVALRGGYRGLAGGGDPDDRDIDAFPSILSGDIGVSGEPDDNCYNVVLGSYTDATAEIEGFTITGGRDERAYPGGRGAGVFILNGSPTIAYCTISGNSVSGSGGGVCTWEGSPTIAHCTIRDNTADSGGGLSSYESSPTVTGCTFSNNQAGIVGGGMSNSRGNPTVTQCTFSGNAAAFYGGGMFSDNTSSNMTVASCMFSGNSANSGGGLYNEESHSLTLVTCTFSGNAATQSAGGIYNGEYGFDALIVNCIVWGNTARFSPQIYDQGGYRLTVTYSCIQGGHEGDGNIDADPLLVDADGPDGVFGTPDDDVHLQAGSPCVNTGDDAAIPSGLTTDYEGEDRIQQCQVDMGADESPHWIIDCNGNGGDDPCDIEEGTSPDCNENGIPDECDIAACDGSPWCGDCNGNGVPDACDIENGTSLDVCPLDGIPDECQPAGACCLRGACIVAQEAACLAAGGEYHGDGMMCSGVECPEPLLADLDGDGDVDMDDFELFQQQFTGPLP